jgi:hypothetical protein
VHLKEVDTRAKQCTCITFQEYNGSYIKSKNYVHVLSSDLRNEMSQGKIEHKSISTDGQNLTLYSQQFVKE